MARSRRRPEQIQALNTVQKVEDLDKASTSQLKQKLVYELLYLMDVTLHQMTQKQLGDQLGVGQPQVSKWCGTSAVLPREKAEILDDKGYETTLGVTFTALVDRIHKRREVAPLSDEVFLASPIASSPDYLASRKSVMELERVIIDHTGWTVYNASRNVEDVYDASQIALRENLEAVKNCKYFVLLLPPRPLVAPSSVWVEAGAAIAWQRPSIYFAPAAPPEGPDYLPYILQNSVPASLLAKSITIHRTDAGSRSAAEMIKRNGVKLFQ